MAECDEVSAGRQELVEANPRKLVVKLAADAEPARRSDARTPAGRARCAPCSGHELHRNRDRGSRASDSDGSPARQGAARHALGQDGGADGAGLRVRRGQFETCASFWTKLRPHGGLYSTGSQAPAGIVEIASSQLGNVGGRCTGHGTGSSRVEWCACFVSWCAKSAGIDSGAVPSSTALGVQWFKAAGRWLPGGSAPAPGDIVFFDWDGDGA
ncbi:MAG: CHAP domain-containing protein [Eggerthellaceae bacterium]